MTALNDGTVAAHGTQNNQPKQKRYFSVTGQELTSTDVDNIDGMTEVKLGGNSAIAVSY